MASIQNSLIPLALVAFVPTISILFTLSYIDDLFASQIFFILCKLWLLLAPAYWYLRVEKNSISWSLPTRDGLVVGGISGIIMSIIIIVMWLLFGDTLDTGINMQRSCPDIVNIGRINIELMANNNEITICSRWGSGESDITQSYIKNPF